MLDVIEYTFTLQNMKYSKEPNLKHETVFPILIPHPQI